MPSTQFRRDPEGVADPAPLTSALPAREKLSTDEVLARMDAERDARRALPVYYGPGAIRKTAAEIIAEAREWATKTAKTETPAALERWSEYDRVNAYLAGWFEGEIERLCVDLNQAQTRPGEMRARIAYVRRMAREAAKQRKAAQ